MKELKSESGKLREKEHQRKGKEGVCIKDVKERKEKRNEQKSKQRDN